MARKSGIVEPSKPNAGEPGRPAMQPKHHLNSPSLIEGLEQVNAAIQVVQSAWRHLAAQQETGQRCALTAPQYMIARGLFTEAIEDWAAAVGRLLALSRCESGLERLSEDLEHSLRCAAAYLSGLAVIDAPAALASARFFPHAFRK